MKKSILNLEGVVALNKDQQRNVFGGLVDGNGTSGSCAVRITNGDGEILVYWGSKSEITSLGGNGGGNSWCCASCSTASWINSCNIC